MIIKLLYKIGQIIGCGAAVAFAFGLVVGRLYEPNMIIKVGEIVASLTGATLLAMDFLDLHPGED